MKLRALIISSAAVLAALAMCGATGVVAALPDQFSGAAPAFASGRPGGIPDGDEITPQDVETAVTASLAERFPGFAGRLQVRVVRIGGTLNSSGGLSIRLPRADGVPSGHTQVRLLSGGGEIGWALLYVAHYDSVAVIQSDVQADQPIEPKDIRFAWLDVTDFRGEPLSREAFLELRGEGKLLSARPLRAGDALRADDLRPPFAADTGEVVVMTYQNGAVVLRLSCEAREPGARGEVIRLYNPDTGTTYKARLTGAGRADWVSTL